jgi:excisionase family DNA binding protein
MRVNEIAAFLGVCSRTVHRLFTDGRLTKIKLGQRATGARRAEVLALGGDR